MKTTYVTLALSTLCILSGCIAIPVGPGYYPEQQGYYQPAPAYYGPPVYYGPSFGIGIYSGRGGYRGWR
jgi:hypothetical protein